MKGVKVVKLTANQTPSQSVIIPYTHTTGKEAIDLYNSTKRTAQAWQELLVYDINAQNDDGLWVHSKYGYSVSRRNGKNEVAAIVEMDRLKQGQQILHTAHRTTTTHAAWERLQTLLEDAGIEIISSYRAYGKEHLEIAGGGRINFRTRTSTGGLGEGYDLLVIDEAQEYRDDQEAALKYVVSASKNPQTIFCGTPPTLESGGSVFTHYREDVLRGKASNAGWAEWSVPELKDPADKEAWYISNPSLGVILTERAIQDEIGRDVLDFNIQRLGYWTKYNLKSAITEKEWEALKVDKLPDLKGKLYVGIKYSKDGASVAMSIAAKTSDDKIFIECIDCRPTRATNRWIMAFLRSAKSIDKVVIDGASGQYILKTDMKNAKMKAPILPKVSEIIEANSSFEQAVFSGGICHMAQPSMVQAATNCDKRAIGSGGGFGYKAIKDGVDISILDSAILAYWIASESKSKKKQRIIY